MKFKIFTGKPVEMGRVIKRNDSGYLEFKELKLMRGSVVELDTAGNVSSAWAWDPRLLKDIDGPAFDKPGKVLFVTERDIIFDPYNQIDDTDITKPKSEDERIKIIRAVSNVTVQSHAQEEPGLLFNRAIMFMGIVMVILALALGIKAAF